LTGEASRVSGSLLRRGESVNRGNREGVAPVLYLGGVAGVSAFLLALAIGRNRRRVGLLIGLGVCLALAWILFAYFSANPSDQASDCSDCGVYLGRWWEPGLVLFIVGTNFVAWVAGVFVGVGFRSLPRPRLWD
jgi:hypothetical protein